MPPCPSLPSQVMTPECPTTYHAFMEEIAYTWWGDDLVVGRQHDMVILLLVMEIDTVCGMDRYAGRLFALPQ